MERERKINVNENLCTHSKCEKEKNKKNKNVKNTSAKMRYKCKWFRCIVVAPSTKQHDHNHTYIQRSAQMPSQYMRTYMKQCVCVCLYRIQWKWALNERTNKRSTKHITSTLNVCFELFNRTIPIPLHLFQPKGVNSKTSWTRSTDQHCQCCIERGNEQSWKLKSDQNCLQSTHIYINIYT